jgi:hypothetical protein
MHASPRTGFAAGVPYLAVPPLTPRPDAPVVVAWHLLDPPRSEAAMAAALPMAGLDAWRIYLGLPLCGARLPPGGWGELQRLASTDAVREVHGPLVNQGATEFPAAFAALRAELSLGRGALGVLGGSSGSAVAQLVLVETAPAAELPIAAAVLVSPVVELRAVVDALGLRYGVRYEWTEPSLAIARRLDFPARADDFARAGRPAVRLVVGAQDDRDGFLEPARRLEAALGARYGDPARVDLAVVPGMGHALAEEPGIEPAPQLPQAAVVDRLVVEWFRRHLPGAAGTAR